MVPRTLDPRTACVQYIEPHVRRARAGGQSMLADVGAAAAKFMRGVWASAEQRLLAAHRSDTHRSVSLIGGTLRARTAFDEWASLLKDVTKFNKSYSQTWAALGGDGTAPVKLLRKTPGCEA